MIKIPALRSLVRIETPIIQNSRRFLSFKLENTSSSVTTPPQNAPEEALQNQDIKPQDLSETTTNLINDAKSFRYNVCQPRTTPIDKSEILRNHMSMHQNQAVKATIEEQNLQPAMLKEYYQQSMERSVLVHPSPEPNEESKVNTHQKKFQESKTYSNAILPLKSVKLASPFPEPVKSMMSHTVSDSEKAQQAFAESRSTTKFSDWGRIPSNVPSRTFCTASRRWYSKTVGRDPNKCKKFDGGKKGCPKLKIDNCPAPARVKCDRLARQIDCKKQLAPYPAYSEFCHEEIDEKPSECKLCPWKTEENPNFKPPKKHLHTSVFPMRLRRSGLELDQSEPTSTQNTTEILTKEENPPKPVTASGEQPASTEGMLCDMRKGQCERPKNRRCPPTKEELRKKKEEEEKKRKKDRKKRCDAIINNPETSQQVQDAELPDLSKVIAARHDKKHEPKSKKTPCKIPRFKFPKCDPPKRSDQFSGRCPGKKKKPLVEDCPPCGKCTFDGLDMPVKEYQMKRDEVKKDRSKCPKVDLQIARQDEDDDPCNLKRKGITKICPGDLLKRKKRKPKKPVQKHSEVVPPEPKKEPPQPTTRIM